MEMQAAYWTYFANKTTPKKKMRIQKAMEGSADGAACSVRGNFREFAAAYAKGETAATDDDGRQHQQRQQQTQGRAQHDASDGNRGVGARAGSGMTTTTTATTSRTDGGGGVQTSGKGKGGGNAQTTRAGNGKSNMGGGTGRAGAEREDWEKLRVSPDTPLLHWDREVAQFVDPTAPVEDMEGYIMAPLRAGSRTSS